MSTLCPHCGRDFQSDDETYLEVINELPNVVALPNATLDKIKEAIGLLNCMVQGGEIHSQKSRAIVATVVQQLRKLE